MKKLYTLQDLQNWRKDQSSVALVPTMGALHDGHLSLVDLAKSQAQSVIVSIFVNPTQFAPDEDLATYPRQEDEDCAKLERLNVDAVYMPAVETMYPDNQESPLKAGKAAHGLESDFRPTHFDGVVTIVGRLFEQIKPDVAVFGEKDFQQLCVLREAFPDQTIVGAPIVRGAKGLALSSRNAYLSAEHTAIAQTLNQVLFQLADLIREYPEDAQTLIPLGIQTLYDAGFEDVDYVELRADPSLAPLLNWNRKPARLLAAAHVGGTRLIDNVAV